MDLPYEVEYQLLMNWGVFKNDKDTNGKFTYGAKKL